jgi:hypothetical protein
MEDRREGGQRGMHQGEREGEKGMYQGGRRYYVTVTACLHIIAAKTRLGGDRYTK